MYTKLDLNCSAGDANLERDKNLEFMAVFNGEKVYHLSCVPEKLKQNIVLLHVPTYKFATELNPYFEFESKISHEKITSFLDTIAVAEMLIADILFVGWGDIGYERTELLVICNDIFMWGSADYEKLPAYEIQKCYEMWKADPNWGAIKWCCIHRNLKPQNPVVKDMKRDGVWDEIMENLPENEHQG